MVEQDVYLQLTKLNIPVYPVKIKQNSPFPCATYMVVSEVKKNDLDANIYGVIYRMQVNIWSKSYKEVKELANRSVSLLSEIEAKEINLYDLYEDEVELYRIVINFNLEKGE